MLTFSLGVVLPDRTLGWLMRVQSAAPDGYPTAAEVWAFVEARAASLGVYLPETTIVTCERMQDACPATRT